MARHRRLDGRERLKYVARTLAEAPGLLRMDRRDRTDFLRHFYRRYADAPVEQIDTDVEAMLTGLIISKCFPEGIRRVRLTELPATAPSSSQAHFRSTSLVCAPL